MYVPQFLTLEQLAKIRASVGAPANAIVKVYDGSFPPHYDETGVCIPHHVVCQMFGKPARGKTWANNS